VLSIYWCGFDQGFCSQSEGVNDIYEKATHVIMAYATIDEDGNLETGNFDQDLINEW